MGRREAREAAMTLLYCIDYHKEGMQYQIESFFEEENIVNLHDNDKKYILEIANGVSEKLNDIDPIIEKNSRGWAFNRIPGIDVAVLRLSIFEMFFREDIPSNVSINEAVDLAKKYGHDESGAFVNGTLGNIYREGIKDGTLKDDR